MQPVNNYVYYNLFLIMDILVNANLVTEFQLQENVLKVINYIHTFFQQFLILS